MLEKSTKLLPLLSILTITLGFVYLRSFYSNFGIQIVDYLELSEVLTLFLDKLHIFYISIVSYFIFNISLYISSYERAREREARGNDIKIEKATSFNSRKDQIEKKALVRKKLRKALGKMGLVATIVAVVAYGLTYKYLDSLNLISVVVYGGYVGLIFGEYVADLEVFSKTRFDFIGRNPIQMAVLIVLTLNTARALSMIEVNLIKKKHRNINVSFVLDDTLIQSDTSCYYLGKTKNFLFYYEADQPKATVYPMNRIKQISFIK